VVPLILDNYKWREEFKPQNLRYKNLKYYNEGALQTFGKDRNGNPVQYLILRNFNIDGTQEQLDFKFEEMVYNYELNTRMMKEPDVYQVTTVVELLDGSISASNSFFIFLIKKKVKAIKSMFDKIGHCYPERSNRVIILNAGWTFSAIWYFVKSFLSAETISKYIFIDGYYEDVRVKKFKKKN
jgi:hypothetical protein